MATTNGPDLTAARVAVEKLLDDECLIRRDSDHNQDATLNETTYELEHPDPRTVDVYEGACMITPMDSSLAAALADDSDDTVSRYELKVPIDAPALQDGDEVTILSARRDSGLVGKTFYVRKVLYSSMAVWRKVQVELVT